jgi:hypothetical protein
MTEEKLRINLKLKDGIVAKFKAVKEEFGLEKNTNVLRVLILMRHKEIEKGVTA